MSPAHEAPSPLPLSSPVLQHGPRSTGTAHDDHPFDPEPATALALDEPRTPGWIPAVGLVLFLGAVIAFLATRDAPPRGSSASVATTATPGGAVARPVGTGASTAQSRGQRALTPPSAEQLKEIQARAQRAAAAASGAPAADAAARGPAPPAPVGPSRPVTPRPVRPAPGAPTTR